MWESIAAAVAPQIIGGLMGGDSASEAAGIQSGAASDAINAGNTATEKAIAENRRYLDTTRADLAPYMGAGSAATRAISSLMGLPDTPAGGGIRSWIAAGALTPDSVQALYQLYLGRAASPAEVQWQLQNTQTAENFLAGIRSNAEYQSRGIDVADPTLDKPIEQAPINQTAVLDSPLNRKFTMDDFNADPVNKAAFDFGLSEGEKAVQRMFGARGLGRSGAAVKAATRFATDYSGQKAGESRARFVEDQNNLFTKLTGVSGTGLSATGTAANAGGNVANANATLTAANGANTASLITGAGNARGAAAIAGGNAMSGALSNIGSTISGQYTLDKILNRGGINGSVTRPSFSLGGSYMPGALPFGMEF